MQTSPTWQSPTPHHDSFWQVCRSYWQLTKPRIIPLLLIETAASMLVAAHGNSLRALVKMLDQISADEITGFNIPTGVPIIYEFNDNLEPLSREFVGDAAAVAEAAAAVANQGKA